MDQFRFTFAIFGAIIYLAMLCFTLVNADGEPTCYSRFDYDMKMFETVADMKQNLKTLTKTVTNLQELVENMGSNEGSKQKALTNLETSLIEQQHFLQKLEVRIALQEKSSEDKDNSEGGSTYHRWGRTTCPGNGSTIIYQGTVGGSSYSQSGSGADYQCLPVNPTWGRDRYQDGTQGAKSYMYGSEYEPGSLHFDDLTNKEVPCAVCLTTRSTVIMIPARTSCYPGWTMEYEGNLVSAHHGHKRTQYICVDKDAESAPGSDSGNQNGALFYTVEARCGSLHCPPYVEGRELACAVCSK